MSNNSSAANAPENGTMAEAAAMHELRQELAKWQERVPKLAAALRERTEQADRLQAEVDSFRDTGTGSAGSTEKTAGPTDIESRQQLITELEAKLKALNSKHQDLEGQVYSRDMEISDLQQDVGAWKDKWQAASSNLDDQGSQASNAQRSLQQMQTDFSELTSTLEEKTRIIEDRDHELAMLSDETESLNGRNGKLFETIELANRQIETLGENLTELRDQVSVKNDALRNVADGEALQAELNKVQRQDQDRERDLQSLMQRIESLQTESKNLSSELGNSQAQLADLDVVRESEARLQAELSKRVDEIDGLTDRMTMLDQRRAENEPRLARLEAQLEKQQAEKDHDTAMLEERYAKLQGDADKLTEQFATEHEEVTRLNECIANADQVVHDRDDERRQLSQQLNELTERNQHLETQLNERSHLVVGLEQEKDATHSASQAVDQENAQLREAVVKAERHASEHAEHISALDSQSERQKEHMLSLEQDLADAQGECEVVRKDRAKTLALKDAQISELQGELEVSSEMVEQSSSVDDTAHEELVANMAELEAQLARRTEVAEQAGAAIQLLEDKLAHAKASSDSADSDSGDVGLLQEEVHKLEQMVRDRTEQLNTVQWQQDMTERAEVENIGGDNKMLIVLNQQLTDARDSNKRLLNQVRELEAQLATSGQPGNSGHNGNDAGGATETPSHANAPSPDDLTAIKGIGPKLAAQLRKLGVASFGQIAELEERDLEADDHLLNTFKKRIFKDGWISQARALSQH